MSDIKVAVLDKFHPHIKVAITAAMPSNWSVRFIEENSLAARAAVLRDADIAFVMAAPVPKELLAEARLHAGNSVPVAEHTILLMLATYRQLPQIDRRTRAGAWNKEDARGEHRHLHGKIVGLVGFGAIGKEVAKRLRGFEVKILYYDPVRASRDVEQSLAVDYADLDTLVRSADIISLHLPLMPQTAGLINTDRIRAMKSGAVVINCARGGLVDESALAAALKEGRLFGAGIDAFANEPPVGSELLELDNTVV